MVKGVPVSGFLAISRWDLNSYLCSTGQIKVLFPCQINCKVVEDAWARPRCSAAWLNEPDGKME